MYVLSLQEAAVAAIIPQCLVMTEVNFISIVILEDTHVLSFFDLYTNI